MQKDLNTNRKSYEKDELLDSNLPEDPFEVFEPWFELADEHPDIAEANAMNLATVDTDGTPKSRIVLLKAFNSKGFIFYSNYNSEKGKAIESNPKVCLSFFWPALERQVIIKGDASKISNEKSQTYFHSRPQGSQLGALASNQSSVVPSREYLESRLNDLEKKYKNKEVPLPENWGGYVVNPKSIEFWQGRKNRLHDRILYIREPNNFWKKQRLAP